MGEKKFGNLTVEEYLKAVEERSVQSEVQKAMVRAIAEENVITKRIYPRVWISGSVTEVYPIMFWRTDVVLQMANIVGVSKAVQRIVEKHPDLFRNGYVTKSDGSCPATITFKYSDSALANIK